MTFTSVKHFSSFPRAISSAQCACSTSAVHGDNRNQADLVEFWDQTVHLKSVDMWLVISYNVTCHIPFSFRVSLHSFLYVCCLRQPAYAINSFSFAYLKDVTNSDQNVNAPLGQVSVASKASDATRILSYCTVYIVVQDRILFQLTLFNNNQAFIIVICYDIVMLCFIPKRWAHVVLLFK